MSEIKKVYLEDGDKFTIARVAEVSIIDSDMSKASINWNSVVDPASSILIDTDEGGIFVGEFTDADSVVRGVYLNFVDQRFYYYDGAVEKKKAPHKTYLKAGETFDVQWKGSTGEGLRMPVDIDEAKTFSDENLAHTEVGNDGPVRGTFVKDGVTYDIFLERFDNGDVRLYCYLN